MYGKSVISRLLNIHIKIQSKIYTVEIYTFTLYVTQCFKCQLNKVSPIITFIPYKVNIYSFYSINIQNIK